jgi:hypothetical protein
MMSDVYLYVGFVALIVAMLGLLACAIHSVKSGNRRVMQELAESRKLLERELRTLREAQLETVRDTSAAGSPERPEVPPRNSELETLRLLILHQDEEIRMLQREAEDMHQSLAGLSSTAGLTATVTALVPDRGQEEARGDQMRRPTGRAAESGFAMGATSSSASFGKRRDPSIYEPMPGIQFSRTKERRAARPDEHVQEAGWKENLDGILNMLDAMEREVQN